MLLRLPLLPPLQLLLPFNGSSRLLLLQLLLPLLLHCSGAQ